MSYGGKLQDRMMRDPVVLRLCTTYDSIHAALWLGKV